MRNKIIYFILATLLATTAYSCKDKITADFSYDPAQPKIGEQVAFTNLSSGGDDFEWTFKNLNTGSISRSLHKSPKITFTRPGDYDITLRVDSNNNYVRTKSFYVYDSIPHITRNTQNVNFYKSVKYSTLAYNPFGRTKTYQWFFSENARGESLRDTLDNMQVSYEEEPVVFFTKRGVEETVSLRMTIGDSVYTIDQIKKDVFTVSDTLTRSLLIARKNNQNILRQRIFDNGIEEATETNIPSGKHAFNIMTSNKQLFVFDAGTHVTEDNTVGDGNIRIVNLENDQIKTIIKNEGTNSYNGFYNGYVDSKYVYWSDYSDFVYKIDRTKTDQTFQWLGDDQYKSPYYVARVDSLGHFGSGLAKGQFSGGVYLHDRDGVFYWAKGGTGKGIYRFKQSNIKEKIDPVLFPDYSIRAFAVDRANNQIYFSVTAPANKVGLWVANIDGTHERQIDNSPMANPLFYITGIVVDNTSNNVFWAYTAPENLGEAYFEENPTHRSGIKQIKRLTSNIAVPDTIIYFNNKITDAYGIALDDVPKYGK
ncbi:hypothetical protein D0T49_00015 [Paludibacter sp. 221]|uniref:PKD domain-containing protein n=1 Tax=Paludibacter sp. 221 TaxID=2302939 RepID=UPI0013D0718A|nr:PKD domain-containing protein [Paludibacter sp. 221]NDV45440.1 hypothetical protein [Paludibacter sp. 221]